MNTLRRRAVLGAGLLAGVLLAVAAYLVHFQARWAVARYERQLQDAGETLALTPLLPPPVLPERNGALLFSQARLSGGSDTNLLNKNPPVAMLLVAPGKAMIGWAQPDVRADTTNQWSEIEAALAQYDDSLDVVREAVGRPVFDFQLDYRQGFDLLLPHLAPLKRATQLLTADTLCALHRGDVATGTTNVESMLALVKATAEERLAISQLVRIAMAAIAMSATWELLQAPGLGEDQLAAVQRGWVGLRFVEPTEDALAADRALSLMTLKRMRNSSAQFRRVAAMAGPGSRNPTLAFGNMVEQFLEETAAGAKEATWRFSSSYPDQLRALKGYQALLESFRAVRAGQPFVPTFGPLQERLTELGLRHGEEESGPRFSGLDSGLRSLFSDSVLSLSRVLNRVFSAEAARALTVTALALKRYQLRHGQYPAQLSALVPEFLPAPPRDPADGKPLRYRLNLDGSFLLYSIGDDGTDHGGDGSPIGKYQTLGWQKGRDLVWPCPATPEEISAYRQKQASKRGR